MKYHQRILENKILEYFETFSCLLVAGARQAGKSTVLQELFSNKIKMFTFDPAQDLYGEKADPDLFLRNNPHPLILDEIQYAPGLAASLKRYVDQKRTNSMFIMTGSQQWHVMKSLSESMAGRIAMIELQPFSLSETFEVSGLSWFPAWLDTVRQDVNKADEFLLSGRSYGLSPAKTIWRGSFPEVQRLKEKMIPAWMQGYVSTYLQRDVRSMMDVRDEGRFAAFLSLCVALTGQESNYSQIGRDIGLSTPTARRWLDILRGTFQWLEVPAYSTNQIKKLSQKPKGYLMDTGLASYLLRISSPEALSGHPSFGALFETFMVMELYKQVQTMTLAPVFYHFRLHSGAEVDLVLELDGKLFPVEIKSSSRAGPKDAGGMRRMRELLPGSVGPGILIYAGDKPVRIDESCIAVPFDLCV